MKVKSLDGCFGGTWQSFQFYIVFALGVFLLVIFSLELYRKGKHAKNKSNTNSVEQNMVTPVTPVNSFGSLEHILDFSATNQINAYLTEGFFGQQWVVRGFNVKPWSTVVYYPNTMTVEPIVFPRASGPQGWKDDLMAGSIPVKVSVKLADGSVLWQVVQVETLDPRHTLFVAINIKHLRVLQARIIKKG